jgi:fumarylacetoacetase
VTDPFGPHNLPYGVLDDECGVRVGDRALRLKALEADGRHIGDGKYLRALDSAPQLPFTVGDYVDFFSSEEHGVPSAGPVHTGAFRDHVFGAVLGATVRTGDLYASGTISGPVPEETGSFIERTWNGAQPVCLDDGSPRTFLEDGDTVTIAGFALRQDRVSVGFGEVVGSVAGAQ